MEVKRQDIRIFKVKNRRGYAAVYADHLTEGDTEQEALDRMQKALKRTSQAPVAIAG